MNSEKSFQCLHTLLLVFLAFAILLGALIAVLCEYVKLFLQSHFFQIDSHEVQSVIFIVKIYGLHISICFCCGIVVVSFFGDVYTRHLGFVVRLWIFFVVESSLGSLFTTWLFVDTMNFVAQRLETSLIDGIKLYTKEPLWVLIWDDLQYDYKCCGVHNHTDWTRLVVHRMTQNVASAWLPFSCAKGHQPMRATLDEENIHLTGCFFVISDIIERLKMLIVSLNVLILIVMVLIIILLRAVFIYKRNYTELRFEFESEES